MARTYTRDARGRFASKGAGSLTTTLRGAASKRAPRRLEFQRLYHGTSKEAARSIRAEGQRISPYGTFGPGVYATTTKSDAKTYANWRAKGGQDRFGDPFPASKEGPAVLTYRVSKRRVRTDAGHGGDLKGYETRDWIAAGNARRTLAVDGSMGVVIMDKALADRSLIRESGMIRRRRRR